MGHCTLVFEPSARALLWDVTSVLVSRKVSARGALGRVFEVFSSAPGS